MHPMLTIAVKAARRAGGVINRASKDLDLLTVQRKSHNEFVSDVDRAAENAIIETLTDAYPNHAFLGEEGGQRGDSEFLWIIDPLDGTTNFLHGFPQYCVSIALVQEGVLTHGVVYDPVFNRLFSASRGRGAYLDDRRIRVAKRDKLADALLGTGFPYRDFTHVDRYLEFFREMMQKSAGIRRPGAAALDLAYVAAGWLDGFWEIGLKPWDVAAGALLVKEAGGLIGDFRGDEDFLYSGQTLAGSPKIFGLLVQALTPLVESAPDIQ